MGVFRNFPYSNFHEMNLDWLLSKFYELSDKFDKFTVDTTNIIIKAVNKWLSEHPESLAPEFFKTFNEVSLHKVAPEYISEDAFIPDSHSANGFTADENYFYIAHHITDEDFLSITRVDKVTLESNSYTMPFKGHGNTISYYNGYLYICDSTNLKVDVVSASDPETLIGSFRLDPNANGFSIKSIDNRIITCSTETNNNMVLCGEVVNGTNQIINNLQLLDSWNSYIQGIDHTYHCIYISRSYGREVLAIENLPTITAYSWSGKVLNTMYIDVPVDSEDNRDIEIEDIWRDSANNRIYFVTASGKIGSVDTYLFTTGQTAHALNAPVMRSSSYLPMFVGGNTNSNITYRAGTTLAEQIKINPFTTAYQGMYIGMGLVFGITGFYYSRGGEVIGVANSSSDDGIFTATVTYTINANGTLTYNRGKVYRKVDNAVNAYALESFSAQYPDRRTCINTLSHIPDGLFYGINLPTIPLP